MPGFDGTGPAGMGPMTGRGMGYCIIPLNTPEEEKNFLKNMSRMLQIELRQLESRIEEMEKTQSTVKI
ncbi:MAG: hypothetical protein EHM12_00630 [Dehalococcoidia bacterium]|nr:MAG: hypothetical protein EHM12_00630 [Dehalococcoidia bacterium]